MSEDIRIGVAGAGVFGAHHSSKYAQMARATLAGVFDIDTERANKLASLCNTQAFDDFEALLGAVDAVVIASPASTHYRLARLALEAQRHVFVEKPLSLNVQEAEELSAFAKKQDLTLQVGHQERYVAMALGLMDYDAKPLRIECVRCAAPSGRCQDVSAVFDLMIHDFDLVRQLTKSQPEKVTARGHADEAEAELLLMDGVSAQFKVSRSAAVVERRMRLIYEEGFIEIDFMKRTIVNTTSAPLKNGFDDTGAPLAFTDPLGFGAERFVAAIVDGEDVHVTGQDGADATSWACAVENVIATAGVEVNSSKERVRA